MRAQESKLTLEGMPSTRSRAAKSTACSLQSPSALLSKYQYRMHHRSGGEQRARMGSQDVCDGRIDAGGGRRGGTPRVRRVDATKGQGWTQIGWLGISKEKK